VPPIAGSLFRNRRKVLRIRQELSMPVNQRAGTARQPLVIRGGPSSERNGNDRLVAHHSVPARYRISRAQCVLAGGSNRRLMEGFACTAVRWAATMSDSVMRCRFRILNFRLSIKFASPAPETLLLLIRQFFTDIVQIYSCTRAKARV
jgi:hypothetical protein